MARALDIRATHAALGLALMGVLLLPEIRVAQEARLVTHMLVQLPLLALAGWCLGTGLPSMIPALSHTGWNRGGIPGLIVAVTTLSFWMLPKSLDGSLDDPALEFAKFVTLPFCLGAAFAISWPRAHPLVRGFLKAQFVSMLGVLAFLYTHAPARICNNYLLGEQPWAGVLFAAAAITLAILWGGSLFFAVRTPARTSAIAGRGREAVSHA